MFGFNLVAREVDEIILISRNTDSHKFGTKVPRSAESTWTGELVLEISSHNTLFGRQQVGVLERENISKCIIIINAIDR